VGARLHAPQKLEHRIVYDRKQDAALQAWQAAMAVKDTKLVLPDDFYEQELEQVILAQGITTLEEYRTARRIGRSGVLSRSKRDAVWPVFEEYRGQLASRKLKEVDDAYREVATLLQAAQAKAGDYSAVVVDETQDFGQQALKLLRALIPRAERPVLRRRRAPAHLQPPSRRDEQVRHRHPWALSEALPQLPDHR
jgi:hypothetical protein